MDDIVINLKPFEWQVNCLNCWILNNFRGIVKVVTGAGKSLIGMMAIECFWRLQVKPIVIIIVPTKALQLQWQTNLVEHCNIRPEFIGMHGGNSKKENYQQKFFHIFIINTARNKLSTFRTFLRSDSKFFLIADECHRYGSKINSRIFDFEFDYTLGLSATPERENDFGFEKNMLPNIGNIIFQYGYGEALRDGVISPFKLTNICFELTPSEEMEYERLTKKMNEHLENVLENYPILKRHPKFFAMLQQIKNDQEKEDGESDENITTFMNLSQKRKQLLYRSENRLDCIYFILSRLHHFAKIIIFHELIEELSYIENFLRDREISSKTYHSKMPPKDRLESLDYYRNNKSTVLLTCKALDEGLDVPDTHIAILAASTKGTRQRIQRVGRVLRKAEGKDFALIFSIYAKNTTEEERYDFKKESELFGITEIEYKNYDCNFTL
jgi:superfamily II DNA or RNA helicase